MGMGMETEWEWEWKLNGNVNGNSLNRVVPAAQHLTNLDLVNCVWLYTFPHLS
jgi:hypothetical protein